MRKTKHRELVKRSYYQKLEVLKQLQQQERSLSAQHSALLRYIQTRPPVATSDDSDASSEKMEMKLVTADMFFEVIRPAYAEVRSFRTSRDLYTSNVQVLGWTHRHRLEGSNLQYSIAKFFPAFTARELCDRGWGIMTTESSYQALHSRGMTSNLHSIQVMDEDNQVFCRELQRPGQGVIMKTLFLASRFQTEDGHMTIYRALDHDKLGFTGVNSSSNGRSLTQAALASKWLDMFAWTSFEDRSDGSGVEFHFGGEMKHFSVDNAHFWMMEVLLMALRWESRAVGPLITLQPSE
ncbi:hypothetical protein BBJ29_007283 [Phytophthora kernoviae]|uniref:START domain-containing protein n=1 Tax=Phytophthora kernoviae TaxID=325452 RepID=A0A3F2RUB2_9STRA|nr:hypothetical protein BBP00_00003487 [Phytophthora kernoviae]RLN70986.1 hypothetical protein BBJ29_007283 [Phytophthora kernoviae]